MRNTIIAALLLSVAACDSKTEATETKSETKPEAKAETKTETKPETKSETKTETKPETKSETKTE